MRLRCQRPDLGFEPGAAIDAAVQTLAPDDADLYLARCKDGSPLDRRSHAGGRQGLPPAHNKAHKQLPLLRAALLAHQAKHTVTANLEQQAEAA